MNDDEITLKRYQNLFQISVRAFYEEMTIVVVDYMVLNCRASMTEEQFEQSLKLPIKKIRAALHKMKEDELIREDVNLKRWTLSSNIKEILQTRLAFIKVKLAEKIAATNIKKYKCSSCSQIFLAGVMALYQGKCPNCRNDLIEMERDSNAYVKLKDIIQKIEEKYIDACKGREFPAKMYPEEYHKLWESETKATEFQLPIIFTGNEKPLYKKVLEKINEQRKGKNQIKTDESLLGASNNLHDYYKQHPTKLDARSLTTADLLKKRKSLEKLSDREYQEEYMRYFRKIYK